MTTNHPPPATDRQSVFESLFRLLCEHHHGRNIRSLTVRVHQKDTGCKNLVALEDGCESVIYYETLERSLRRVSLDTLGLPDESPETLWAEVGDAACWVDANETDLIWVHPRYRWVLELDDQQSAWSYRE